MPLMVPPFPRVGPVSWAAASAAANIVIHLQVSII